MFGNWLLAAGWWLPAAGGWLLAADSWLVKSSKYDDFDLLSVFDNSVYLINLINSLLFNRCIHYGKLSRFPRIETPGKAISPLIGLTKMVFSFPCPRERCVPCRILRRMWRWSKALPATSP